MSTAVLRPHDSHLASAVGAQVSGRPIYAGGNPVTVQFVGPAALGGLEGSSDRINWAVLNDAGGVAIAGQQNSIRRAVDTPPWVRHVVTADAGGPRNFDATVSVIKEST